MDRISAYERSIAASQTITTSSNDQAGERIEQQVKNETYYHGLLPREDVRSMLRKNGDFLLRLSEPTPGKARQMIVSMMVREEKDELKHFIVRRFGDKVCIEKFAFGTIQEMINHHLTRGDPLSKSDPMTILRNGIGRQEWELSHDDIECTKKLGEGAYGEVHMGTLKTKAGKTLNVAIKLAKLEAMTKEQIKEVMREARLMKSFDHPNIVKFHGVAAGTEPLMVVMELADGGALDSYLQKNESIPPSKRMEMCMQAAWGIEYMHVSRNCLHRDIAARNCLYADGQVKISDFGLTREGSTYQMNPHQRVPIRWLAPEVLSSAMYSQKTDVWAFGIMCWEIMAGSEPYPGMSIAEVNYQVRKEKYRMPFPESTPPDFATFITKNVLAETPIDRLTMEQVVQNLEQMTGLKAPVKLRRCTATILSQSTKTRTKRGALKDQSVFQR